MASLYATCMPLSSDLNRHRKTQNEDARYTEASCQALASSSYPGSQLFPVVLKSPPTLCTTTHLFPLATSSSTPETPSLTTSRKTPGMSTCMQPVCLCRRTPFMISSLHFTVVVMLIMKMSTRRDCGSVCNLYASAVGLSSL